MDISNDAHVDPFSIGPTSVFGRTIAYRILFCKSISHLRRELFRFVLNIIHGFKRSYLAPILSWFHPRNPQGILAMVTIIAFLLKRYTNVKTRAEMAYRRKFWRNMMRGALTYEEWSHAAKMLDKVTPKVNESDLYDEELVKNKLQELLQRRQQGSLRDITFFMRADLIRNLGNMCNSELHKGRLQVPRLIKEYIDEVSTQLRMVCESDSDELSLEEKLAFMHETRHAFGRTALLLSGGASLGSFHVGVVKTLVEHKVLPRIIAGSSVGSIMCSVVATRSWPELQSFFEDSWMSLQFFDQLGGIFSVVKRVMTQGAVHEIRQLQCMLRSLTSNLTFQEAYDMTGRILGITVCSPRKHEPPRCLNYLTSPHVVIWSAVTASCAFPGLFEAQELMAKDRSGEIVPYHPPFNWDPEEGSEGSGPSVRRWRDGSLEIDLPMIQLKELFNVNHFIVSQANPHIAPLLRLKEFVRAYGGRFAAKLAHLTEMEVKHKCHQIVELGFPLGGLPKLFAQDWEGDVTVVMPATLAQYLKIIQNPSHVELQKASNQGRRCTWEKLSTIKANCGIELALDESVAILNHMRRLKRSAVRASGASAAPPQPQPPPPQPPPTQPPSHGTQQFSGSRRIPSWNCMAREYSTSSFEDDAVVDVSPTFQQGVTLTSGIPSGLMFRSYRNMMEGSESDPDSPDFDSWTRSGGPLMRTNSANKFIDFVQNFDINEDFTQGFPIVGPRGGMFTENEFDQRDHGNRTSVNGVVPSITVTDGDYLQPEFVENGIVFNVVKREDLEISNVTSRNDDNTAESILLDPSEKELDVSSVSESRDHDYVVVSDSTNGASEV